MIMAKFNLHEGQGKTGHKEGTVLRGHICQSEGQGCNWPLCLLNVKPSDLHACLFLSSCLCRESVNQASTMP